MTDSANPYATPQASIFVSPESGVYSEGITEKTKTLIVKAGPWATFLGVMGFIGSGLFVLIALVSIFVSGLMTSSFAAAIPLLKSLGGATGGIIALLYFVIAAFSFFPSLFMVQIGGASKKYRLRRDASDLERFVSGFKKWIKFYGITLISLLSIYAVVIVFVIIAAVASSAR